MIRYRMHDDQLVTSSIITKTRADREANARRLAFGFLLLLAVITALKVL